MNPLTLDLCIFQAFLSIEDDTDQPEESVFYQVQSLFGHLMESKLQYYVPENFWKVTDCWPVFCLQFDLICTDVIKCVVLLPVNESSLMLMQIFKMWNKELYVREQQDAYEFFTSLVDQLDEHLKVIQTSSVVKVPAQNLEALVFVIISLIMKLFLEQKMGREQIFKNTFQGIYSDQKICKDCPHR